MQKQIIEGLESVVTLGLYLRNYVYNAGSNGGRKKSSRVINWKIRAMGFFYLKEIKGK